MPLPPHRAWFPAKVRGWGWGAPTTWQGRVVLVAFAIVLGTGLVLLRAHPVLVRVGYVVGLCVLLCLVCWWKGEPPRWRDGTNSAPPGSSKS